MVDITNLAEPNASHVHKVKLEFQDTDHVRILFTVLDDGRESLETITLARIRHLYIDDLVTDEASRSHSHGAALFKWLLDPARARGCRQFDLDPGVQRHRAPRFYFREGMHLAGCHFKLSLS